MCVKEKVNKVRQNEWKGVNIVGVKGLDNKAGLPKME